MAIKGQSGQLHELPEHMRHRVRAVVPANEKILWVGRPTWRAMWGRLLLLFLFGAFWSAISFPFAAMIAGSLTGIAPIKFNGSEVWPVWAKIFMPLFITPFVVIGCWLLAAPFVALRESMHVVHVLTDQRILDVLPNEFRHHALAKISSLERKPRHGGRGTLTIGLGWERDSEGDLTETIIEWSGVLAAEPAEQLLRGSAPQLRSRGTV